ncbi:MAG: hypothetical protein PWP31_1578 [Clostridia bacterium]|nr:hypothetical protein [Clostridia bacterium]
MQHDNINLKKEGVFMVIFNKMTLKRPKLTGSGLKYYFPLPTRLTSDTRTISSPNHGGRGIYYRKPEEQ